MKRYLQIAAACSCWLTAAAVSYAASDMSQPVLRAIDPSQAQMAPMPAPVTTAAPPSPNPIGSVQGAPIAGNRNPPQLPAYPYPYPYQAPAQGYPYPQQQQYSGGYGSAPAYQAPYGGQPAYTAPPPAYGAPPAYGGAYGAPPAGYAPQQGYGYPPQQGYAYPPPQQQYAAPPQGGQYYGGAPAGSAPPGTGYGAPQGTPYRAPAQPYGNPPPGAGYGAPRGSAGYSAPPPSTTYGAAPYGAAPGARYGAQPPQAYAPAAPSNGSFPSENMIPDFNKPLPPGVSSHNNASGFAAGPQAPQQSADEQRISRLEQSAFGSTYPEHEVDDRIDHLEKEIFGATSEAPMDERIAKLEAKLGGSGSFTSSGDQIAHGASPGGGRGGFTPQSYVPPGKAHNKAARNEENKAKHSGAKAVTVSGADYFDQIKHFDNDTVARWRTQPVRIHLPSGSPESWQRSLDVGIKRWGQYIQLQVVPSTDPAEIEVSWVNHLTPQYLGITRLTMPPGQMQVQIFMLRPTYYLPEIPERVLQSAFEHELGHGIGIFGHSTSHDDIMYAFEIGSTGKGKGADMKFANISERDIATLKRIYNSPPTPPEFSLAEPLEWGCLIDEVWDRTGQ